MPPPAPLPSKGVQLASFWNVFGAILRALGGTLGAIFEFLELLESLSTPFRLLEAFGALLRQSLYALEYF